MRPNTEYKHRRSLPDTLRLKEDRNVDFVHLLRQQKLRGLLFFFYDLLCIEAVSYICRCILDECRKAGLGAECASLQEAKLALQLGAQMAQVYA
jgi:hypothetical protein